MNNVKTIYNINELNKDLSNQTVQLFGIVTRLEEKATNAGKKYVEFILTDPTGDLVVKSWNTTIKDIAFENSDLVKVRAVVNVWDEKCQLIAEMKNDKPLIRQAIEQDEKNIEDYVKSSPISPIFMYEEIFTKVVAFENEELKKISTIILETYKEQLLYFPGAKVVHHAYRGGLLHHIYSMIVSAENVNHYALNMELLITGIIIHDIGKIVELEVSKLGIASDYTKTGSLLGHIIDGIRILDRIFVKEEISEEVQIVLHHMIASHHYEQAFGAYQMPRFKEAELLHQLDAMDSRMNMVLGAVEHVEKGSFSERVFFLNNRDMYVPNLNIDKKEELKTEIEIKTENIE